MRFPSLPADEQMGLVRLATLTQDQIEQLRLSLASTPVRLSRDSFLKGVAAVDGLMGSDQERIVWALTYLNGFLTSGNYEITSFVSDVKESLIEQKVSADDADKIAAALPGLLEIDTIRLRAKAVDLQVNHAFVFQNALVLTDIRPVFAMDAPREVKGALVFHTLKIEYFQNGETREFFVSLDDRDLNLIRKSLDRADAKAAILREILLEKLKVKDLGDEQE
jgi:hypothetical protein